MSVSSSPVRPDVHLAGTGLPLPCSRGGLRRVSCLRNRGWSLQRLLARSWLHKDILPHRACSAADRNPRPGPSARQKHQPSSPIGLLSSEERLVLLTDGACERRAHCERGSGSGNEVMFLDSASLGLMFFIWTLRPHIKKGKKSTSFKSRDDIVVTALGINRA